MGGKEEGADDAVSVWVGRKTGGFGMDKPKVKKGEWIIIGNSGSRGGIDGYVIDGYSDGSLGVGYYQNKIKAFKTDVVWDNALGSSNKSLPQ